MKRHSKTLIGRKHRLPRHAYQGFVSVSITCCIHNRVPLFTNEEIVNRHVAILQDSVEKHKCSAPIYCFMPDHLHLLCRGEDEEADTWGAIVRFKQNSGYWLKDLYPDVRWQRSFYDHVLRDDESLNDLIAYIARNPVRSGLVSHWDEYPFTGSIGWDLQDIQITQT